jgi:hypothetical protein
VKDEIYVVSRAYCNFNCNRIVMLRTEHNINEALRHYSSGLHNSKLGCAPRSLLRISSS